MKGLMHEVRTTMTMVLLLTAIIACGCLLGNELVKLVTFICSSIG